MAWPTAQYGKPVGAQGWDPGFTRSSATDLQRPTAPPCPSLSLRFLLHLRGERVGCSSSESMGFIVRGTWLRVGDIETVFSGIFKVQ